METCEETAPPPSWLQVVLIGRNPVRTLWRIVLLVGVCFFVRSYVLLTIYVEGVSMLPTYKENAFNCVNRLAYVFHEPRHGDVVGIRLRAGRHVMLIKRVVGLPGETVAFRRGHLFVNGKMVYEPYEKAPCDWDLPPVTLAPDEYFVVGDNRSMPAADHTKGRAQRKFILGKVLL
jgi:signal peptidase I